MACSGKVKARIIQDAGEAHNAWLATPEGRATEQRDAEALDRRLKDLFGPDYWEEAFGPKPTAK